MPIIEKRIVVLEDGEVLSFSYSDLMLYHGFSRPAGVAHAFKVMQLTLPLLEDGGVWSNVVRYSLKRLLTERAHEMRLKW